MDNRVKDARELALFSLVRAEKDAKFINLEINSTLKRNELSQSEKGLYTALVYSTVEKEMLLDYLLRGFLKTPVEKLDSEVRACLRLGAVQILYFDKLPDHAVCHESVEIIKRSRCRSASGLVNAVLRGVAREKGALLEKAGNAPVYIKYSIPEWIVSLFESSYGRDKCIEILEGFRRKTPLVLHVNTLKTTASKLLTQLCENGYAARIHPLHPELLVLDSGCAEDLPGFQEGMFFVQGTASALAVRALRIKPDSCVFDVCACPGGKSFAAAMALENRGSIYSSDLHESKLSLIEKGASRLGITIVSASVHDARESFGDMEGCADFVICDVPCSGLGVISKKPDIKNKDPQDIKRLPEIQKDILENSSRLLKKGGRLLYSTCTLNRAENEEVVNAFLEAHTEFVREASFPVTYFPVGDIEDGFFADVIVKV